MAVRPIVALSLLTFALVAGCSDGPPSGDLVSLASPLTIEGSSEATYTPASAEVVNPVTQEPVCADVDGLRCTDPFSSYKFHFMSLPEPSGDGYQVFQVGGDIGERALVRINYNVSSGMWDAKAEKAADESTQFDHFELRMADYTVATATSAGGVQAFVAAGDLSGVTVVGTYKGKTLTLDVSGLPGDGTNPSFVGRLYAKNDGGNLTVAESFPIVNGAQEYVSKEGNIGSYAEFHIHVGTSKIYVYQASLDD